MILVCPPSGGARLPATRYCFDALVALSTLLKTCKPPASNESGPKP